ncbi:MAG: F0F1 ATP synthase subunit A [Bacteroidetes bacterium]|nr:F0F1 ATP synthase subunit A [Bacteroidota bacterium]MBS1632910.1 F0F1 ATP synthase subunit A [Bacteroidota bacterium]
MLLRRVKCLLGVTFSLFLMVISNTSIAQENEDSVVAKEKRAFDVSEVIFGHISDGHDFHFFSFNSGGVEHPVSIPLPVILYSPQRGVSTFMSSAFHHGEKTVEGYALLTDHNMKEWKLDEKKYHSGQIIAVNENGAPDAGIKIYDFSLTRNVVQMIIALALLVWVMLFIAKKYKKGEGVNSAPKGIQGFMEPIITFIRDDVAKPNLGHKYEKYLPYIQTVFFFILINSLVALIPGSANVAGNIAFTMLLALIAFIVILFSSNKHFWKHIFWPPVPHGVKAILIPVEILGIFTKPFALMIRLFANMVAGHIIIICLISLIFIFGALNNIVGYAVSPFSVAFVIFIYFIELLVAFLQAYIFAMLTAVFIGQAFEGEHHEEKVHV